jgi:hypothetical protein
MLPGPIDPVISLRRRAGSAVVEAEGADAENRIGRVALLSARVLGQLSLQRGNTRRSFLDRFGGVIQQLRVHVSGEMGHDLGVLHDLRCPGTQVDDDRSVVFHFNIL